MTTAHSYEVVMRYLAIVLLFLALPAWAAPFLVSDPLDTRADNCRFFFNGADVGVVPVFVLPNGDKICRADLVAVTDGTYTVEATAMASALVPPLESVKSLPFTFTLPFVPQVPPAAPTGLRLEPYDGRALQSPRRQ